jgi:hypothetical protein
VGKGLQRPKRPSLSRVTGLTRWRKISKVSLAREAVRIGLTWNGKVHGKWEEKGNSFSIRRLRLFPGQFGIVKPR